MTYSIRHSKAVHANLVRKYGNKPTIVDDIRFDSKLEAKRYGELKLLQKAGKILGLEMHPRFRLDVAGMHICYYEADFKYFETLNGKQVVEDCKSKITKTTTYQVKKKMMKAIYRIDVVEVFA